MPLVPGTCIGHYEIVGLIGAGGMGEVYRARDLHLRRDVAVKVLPALVADDAERLMRFEREAQTLAALNHPHIATIHGLEAGGGLRALVMELVEGPTLSERIAEGPVPWPEALRLARQIADALEAAHEKGIVHRDLKPANVKLTPGGDVKVLDFGLAKALDPPGTTSSVSNSPTLTARATQMGLILGTAAYMPPEQARSRPVDRRADIWAFGCVLFEIVTRRRAFEGDEVTDVLARVIERDPDWTALPQDTPREIRRLLARCLTKDPKARLRDIGEARVAIDQVVAGAPEAPAESAASPFRPGPARPAWQRFAPWALAALSAAAIVWFALPSPDALAPATPVRVEVTLPADVEFFSGPSLSADGSTVAFVGVRQGIRQVYTRSLHEGEARPVAETETASVVVLTADGETLVFVTTDGWLKRMVRRTGIVEPLASDTGLFTTPAVAPDGTVAFSRGGRLVLRAPAGPERDLVVADAAARDAEFTWPAFSQDGSVVAFRTRAGATSAGSNRLEAVRTDGTGRRVLVEGATQVVYLSHDRIVFEQDGTLRTAGFDASALALRGTPVRLGEKVSLNQTGGIAASVARTGAILMAPPAVLSSRLVWVTSSGVERVIHSPPRGFQNPRVSTPGGLIAFSETGTIWTLDPVRGTFARVSAANEPLVGFPVWSVDGTSLYYRSAEGIQLHRADGEGVRKTLANTGSSDYPASLSPDGSTLVILRITAETAGDLYRTPAGGGDLTPLLVTKAYEGGPQISPDGKWLLYVTNESGGRLEVFLRPFGGADRKWLVSVGGGLHPLWSRDGRQIFYRSGQQMLAVDFSAAPDVRLGTPRVLFDRRYEFGPNLTFPNYALSADGRDFLMVQQEPGGRHLNLVLNWFQNLAR